MIAMKKRANAEERGLSAREYRNADGSILPLLEAPQMAALPGVRHCFTTRDGGVSEGPYRSLDLTTAHGDDKAHVMENIRRVCAALGTDPGHLALLRQVHSSIVVSATEEYAGKGITKAGDAAEADGLVTDVPGLVLGILSADCVPVLLADPVRRVIGACHSGWRGTAARISTGTVERMRDVYGCDPRDLVCAVGPSICRACYEVSTDVAEKFAAAFPGRKEEVLSVSGGGKYQLDLHRAVRISLEEAGVPAGQITVTDVCTSCNPDSLFSFRAMKGPGGRLGAFIMMEE